MGLGLSPNLEASAWIARKLSAYSTGCSNGGWASGPDPLPLGVGAPGGGTHGILHIVGAPPEQFLGWDMGQFKACGVD